MSRRMDILPLACGLLLLLGFLQLVESQCTVGSNFNPNSCGACNFVCLSVPNTIARCTDGLCDCISGWANCDGDNSNGCETRIPSNLVGFRCYGTGRNGKLDVNGGRALGTHSTYVYGAQGTTSLYNYGNSAGILPGDLVIVHQTQNYASIGSWEYNRVVDIQNPYFYLEAPLMRDYIPLGAQVVAVAEFTDANVNTGQLYGPYWNGAFGGILPMMVSGTLTVNSGYSIVMDGRGFRGQFRYCHNCQDGAPGEGFTQFYTGSYRGNIGNGGGGGAKGRDCGHGASGGYGTFGTSVGSPTDVCSDYYLGSAIGGSTAGNSNLRQQIHLGGAGGEGGADEDGAYPGGGGNGAGMIIINAKIINLAAGSRITANGYGGGSGAIYDYYCGGSGCGMAGGGGGAGGGIRLVTTSLSGGGAVTAVGGPGGFCTCGGYGQAPTGGFGRIEAGPGSISMSFNPGFSLPA